MILLSGLKVHRMIQTPIVSCGSSNDAGSRTVFEPVARSRRPSCLPGITHIFRSSYVRCI